MWNKRWSIFLIVGWISFFEIFPQDSIVVAAEETVADSSQMALYPIADGPGGILSQFQRDSLIAVIPVDTATSMAIRHFDGNLAEKYASDNDLNYEREINKSFFQRLKEVIQALLDKLLGRSDISKINKLSDKMLNILLVIVFVVAAYIIVRLFMNHRGRWFFEKQNETVSVDLSNVEKHIHEADFGALLKEAEEKGDIRQSVRLLYLWVLKTFSDDQMIRWNPDKTNIDYLAEIQDKVLQEQFRYLSYLYNYVWYGEFSLTDPEYGMVREMFFRHIKIKPENE